jgi:hypothetical protein
VKYILRYVSVANYPEIDISGAMCPEIDISGAMYPEIDIAFHCIVR